jgi:phosphoserine aminotransferase
MSNSRNFSAGPGALPKKVLEQVQQSVIKLPDLGISILGVNHRSEWFAQLMRQAEMNLRALLSIPETYSVLFLQGGSSLQFSMIPMNFLRDTGKVAQYIVSGYWSSKALKEASLEGEANVVWSGKDTDFSTLPSLDKLQLQANSAYLHYVSNETVEGLAFNDCIEGAQCPIIADMSSDLLSKHIDVTHFDLIYAHAQKNLGPAGVTLVIAKTQMLQNSPSQLHSMLDYKTHLNANSIYNTPCVFSIYVLNLVCDWLLHDIGGLARMQEINLEKAARLYQTLDDYSDHFSIHAQPQFRSKMNVVFKMHEREKEVALLKHLANHGFCGLEGHRSLGGIRASLYNGIELSAVQDLCDAISDYI